MIKRIAQNFSIMINIREFRIGNIIANRISKGYARIRAIDSGKNQVSIAYIQGKHDWIATENIIPVDLTPDVINTISFSHVMGRREFEISTENRRFRAQRHNDLCFHMYHEDTGIGTVCFLHQLQNLIFSIANKELDVNL